MSEITVILPCAGKGSRLGLNYPKELYEISPGMKLIDFSLKHISYYAALNNSNSLKVVIVTIPEKIEVYNYVKTKLKNINVKMVKFNSNYEEWPGSVYSANEEFSKKNIVFLPDTFLSISNNNFLKDDMGNCVIENFDNLLNSCSVVFGVVDCEESIKLKNLGALKIVDKKIVDFKDKPKSSLCKYNGYWATYGFSKEIGKTLYDFLIKNVKNESSNIRNESFFPPKIFRIDKYVDLGTWESIKKFRFLSSTIP